MPHVDPDRVLVTAVWPDEKGLVVRLFNASEEAAEARIRFPDGKSRTLRRTDPDGIKGPKIEGPLPMAPWQLATVRVEK